VGSSGSGQFSDIVSSELCNEL